MAPMRLDRRLYKAFLLSMLLLSVLPAEKAFSQTTLDRLSIAERSDGMGFVARLHLSAAPDSFKVAHAGEHYIQVALYGVDQIAPRVINPERPFVIESIHTADLPNGAGKLLELNLFREQNVRINSYPDVNGRDLLISLFSVSRRAGDTPFVPDNMIVSPYNEQAETPATQPQPAQEQTAVAAEEQQQAIETETETQPVAEQEREPEASGGLKGRITRGAKNFFSHQNPDALYRITPDDPAWDYSRLVLSGEASEEETTYLLRPEVYSAQRGHTARYETGATLMASQDSRFQVRLYSPTVYTSYNKEIPLGQNDGALWQGRGRNWFMRAGVGVQYGPLTMVVRPEVVRSQNREFPLERDLGTEHQNYRHPRFGGTRYQDFLMYADLPLYFGDEPVSSFHLGDSFIQADFKRFAAGISNERIWTGPAVHNPLIFSSNAPGFTHFFFRTSNPLRTPIGEFEGQYTWGLLKDSDYFRVPEFDSRRYVNAFTLNYNPWYIPNFHMGITRAGYAYLDGSFGLSDLFLFLRASHTAESASEANRSDARMHLMSYYFRWLFPAADMEVYGEWGRNDYRRPFRDVILEPQFNRGYVIGFIKRFTLAPEHKLALNTEVTNLKNSSVPATKRDYNIWYESEIIGQGFTHKGQVIGAGIGPGSATQQMHLTYYGKWGIAGISGARVAHKIDRHYKYEDHFRSFGRWPQHYHLFDRHEIELRYAIHATVELHFGVDAGIRYIISNVENRYNIRGSDLNNRQVSFAIRYNFSDFGR